MVLFDIAKTLSCEVAIYITIIAGLSNRNACMFGRALFILRQKDHAVFQKILANTVLTRH